MTTQKINWIKESLEMIPMMIGAVAFGTGMIAWGLDMDAKLVVGLTLGGLFWMTLVIMVGMIRKARE